MEEKHSVLRLILTFIIICTVFKVLTSSLDLYFKYSSNIREISEHTRKSCYLEIKNNIICVIIDESLIKTTKIDHVTCSNNLKSLCF